MYQDLKPYIEKYFKSDKGKTTLKKATSRYQKSDKGKKANLAAVHRYMAKKRNLPSDFSSVDWMNAIAFFGGKCAYCRTSTELQQEHFIPVSLGGGYTKSNIIPACKTCNISKRDKHPLEWLQKKRADGSEIYRQIVDSLKILSTA